MNICKHFDECGGCTFQDIPYQEQVRTKEDRIKELLSVNGFDAPLKPTNTYPQWYYRNKMEFTFAKEGETVVCGLYSKKVKRQVVDITQCLIFSPDAETIIQAIKTFVREKGYEPYNKFSHKGFLRNVVLREAKNTKQLMVGIATTTQATFDKEGFVRLLCGLATVSPIASIYWVGNDAWSDAVVFEQKELLFGEPFIQETIGPFTFNIGIDSFFQVNPVGIAHLYEKITDYAALDEQARVLDLCCGVGCIGIFLSQHAKFVWGVEIKQEIVDAAFINAKRNNIKNISFQTADIRPFLSAQGAFYRDVDLVVVNPPRNGLSKKVIRGIKRLRAQRIFYSSCKPETLFRDLEEFRDSYTLESIEPFDFFPHTKHVECLTILKEKGSKRD